MRDPGWVKRFHRAGRPGAYCRVLRPGIIEADVDVGWRPFTDYGFEIYAGYTGIRSSGTASP